MQFSKRRWVSFFGLAAFFCIFSVNILSGQGADEYKIKSVFFDGGSYYIDYEQREEIMQFLEGEILENYEIHIHSHTDNIGSVEYNNWLSQMRSWYTINFLISKGIPEEKIFIKDHGLFNPEFDNETWEGRSKNRRVDIVLWPLPS